MVQDSDIFNKKAYETNLAVRDFGSDTSLQVPERRILEILRPNLRCMAMLDIGVGTGRTLAHFAPLVKEYKGFDYSPKMIEECRKRFPEVSLSVADATDMQEFLDHTFDFFLFSYNGIDVVPHEKRLQIFKEVRRVGRIGAWFAFSSHNLQGVRKMFTVQLHRNPRRLWISLRRYLLTRLNNPHLSQVFKSEHIIINERAHFLKLKHYYIKPRAQVKQLENVGFCNVRLFGLNGKEILEQEWDQSEDSWIYYLCRIP